MEDDLDDEGRDIAGNDTEATPVRGTTATALLPHPAEVDAGPSWSAQLVVAFMLQVQSKCHKQLKKMLSAENLHNNISTFCYIIS